MSDQRATEREQLPTVSVLVPCYRYGRYLEQGVGSILRQRGVNVRVLIIDDASPDDSFEVAQRISELDSRVEVRRHEANRGHIATYNEGLLEWAQGDYSVLISADDILVEGALARAVAVMETHPNVGMVYGHAINWLDSEPLPEGRTRQTGLRIWKGLDWIRTVCELGHNVITSPEVVVRTKVQRQVGGYRPALPHSGDLEMWLRIAARADVAYIEGADQAYYRIHATNMTVSRSPAVDLAQRVVAFESFFSECGAMLDDADSLRTSSQKRIASEALWRVVRAYDKGCPDDVPIEALKQLATTTYSACHELSEHRAVRWREDLGIAVAPYIRASLPAAVRRRVNAALWRRRWRRKGY